MAAYVEIVFDNSDGKDEIILLPLHGLTLRFVLLPGRLSIESDEVVLRRTVGYVILRCV